MGFNELSQEQALQMLSKYRYHPTILEMDVQHLLMVVGAIQLALRHPNFPDTSRQLLDNWLQNVSSQVAQISPDLASLFQKGNDPAQDVPIPAPQPRPGPAPSLEILIQPTDQLTHVDGVLCRVWHGETDEGVRCIAFIHRIAVQDGEDSAAFDAALLQLPPCRMVPMHEVLKHA